MNATPGQPRGETLRQRTYELLEGSHLFARPLSRWVHVFLVTLITVNVIAVILVSDPRVLDRYSGFMLLLDVFSIGVFTLEYLARIWAAAEIDPARPLRSRLKYVCTPFALVDLAVILPFYLGHYLGIDLRVLRVMRLLRILKFGRYFSGIHVLGSVLRAEARPMFAALMVIGMMIVVASSLMYLVERDYQPEVFGSIPDAMWWATVTLTTVGYGDVVPLTLPGRMIGSIIMVLGVGMVALPAGMLAARFSAELRKRQRKFRRTAEQYALRDGGLSAEELDDLEALRIELCLSREETARVEDMLKKHAAPVDGVCPACRRPLPAAD